MSSEIDITNIALMELGAEIIRSFSEDNKCARVTKIAYPFCRDVLLSTYMWSFAKKTRELSLLDEESPDWNYRYALPSDCFVPFYISPRKELDNWDIEGRNLLCNLNPCVLRYTKKVTDTQLFTPPFQDALAAFIKAKIAPSVVQDKAISKEAATQAIVVIRNAQEVDARLGNQYRKLDETPELDSFVNPGTKYLGIIGAVNGDS